MPAARSRSLVAGAAVTALVAAPAVAQDPETRVVSQERGVTNCSEVEGLSATRSAKVTAPFSDDVTFDDSTLSGSVNVSGRKFSFRTSTGIDAVIVKGGPVSRVYLYGDEVRSDSGLRAAMNPNSGKPYGISHIIFCYDVGGEEAAKQPGEDATITGPRGKTDDDTAKVGVGGDGIDRVRYTVNGKHARTLGAKRGRNVFRLNVDMTQGTSRVKAEVRFESGREATLSRTLRPARRSQVSPQFTG